MELSRRKLLGLIAAPALMPLAMKVATTDSSSQSAMAIDFDEKGFGKWRTISPAEYNRLTGGWTRLTVPFESMMVFELNSAGGEIAGIDQLRMAV